jgi:hypothetical protein
MRWGNLDRVGRSGNSHDRNSNTKDESGDDELGDTFGGGSDDHSSDYDDTTTEHGLSSTISIRKDSGEWSTDHGAANHKSGRIHLTRQTRMNLHSVH